MELRHVKIFLLMAEHLNFSKVAKIAFLSQSSISKYIKTLEDELNGTLFIRDGRHTMLSEFGAAFLPYARDLLEKERESQEFLQNFKDGYQYTSLRIGIDDALSVSPPELFYFYFINAINDVHSAHPGIQFDINYYKSSELQTLIDGEQLDVCLRLMSNYQATNAKRTECNFVCINSTSNFLGVSSKTDISGGYRDVMMRVKTYTFDAEQIPQNVTYAAVNQYGIAAGLKTYKHWSEMYMTIVLGDGKVAAILPGNMRRIAEACGLKLLKMDDFTVKSGIYAFWKKENTNKYISIFLERFQTRFNENPPAE